MLAVVLTCSLMLLCPEPAEADVLTSSCYGEELRGSPTASGVPFDPDGYTAAHLGYAFGTVLAVTSLDTGATVYVTVNDRGPYVGARELDLSQGAAEYLGLTHAGVDYVEFSRVGGGYESYPQTAGYSARTDYQAYSGTESYSSAEATGGGTYVVQSGDTLSGIAAELGTTVEDLAAGNGIENPDLLYAGQTLHY